MNALKLSKSERTQLHSAMKRAEAKYGKEYSFAPATAIASCSCTAHKKSCGWD